MTYDLIIIGAGAAGLMAAAEAGRLRMSTLVCEGQITPARKLLICGGGRCNAANAHVSEKDFNASCRHTLRHVLREWSTQDTLDFFARWGAPLAMQKDGQYFSADDRARTVLEALLNAVQAGDAALRCGARVLDVGHDGAVFKVTLEDDVLHTNSVLVTTGGLSYPALGSDGAGYHIAQKFGHELIPTRPALTPLIAADALFKPLAGIATEVRLTLWSQGRKTVTVDGPMLFTHRGFSGPAALEMSRAWSDAQAANGEIQVDFFPMVPGNDIAPILDGAGQRTLRNTIKDHAPERLVDLLLEQAGVDGTIRPGKGQLRKVDRQALAKTLRALPLPIRENGGYAKAEVTAGGVDLKSVKGSSLESRLQDGLFFAGEVLDVDGRIGGFNLQWAWASGVAAVRGVAKHMG